MKVLSVHNVGRLCPNMVQGRFAEKRGFLALTQHSYEDGSKGVYYACPLCSQTFTVNKKLKHHRKEVHCY